MKGKILFTGLIMILLFTAVSNLVYALELSGPNSITLNQFETKQITIRGDGNFNLSVPVSPITILDSNNNEARISISPTTNLTNIPEVIFDIRVESISEDFNLGESRQRVVTFNATNILNASDTDYHNLTIKFEKTFCEYENEGELKISDLDFDVNEGFGDSDEYWYPLDEIEAEFDVENDGDWDISDIEIKVCLYDLRAKECVMDEDDMDLSDDEFDLDEDDEKTVTLTFDVDPDKLNEENKDYKLYLSATGKIDDSDSPYDDNYTCASISEDIEIRTDEKFIILDDIKTSEADNIFSCGDEVEISADVWNIGDEKIDEDEIFILAYNEELGIKKLIEIDKDIRPLHKEEFTTTIQIPKDVQEKTYKITFTVYDDEDLSDKDIYENEEDDEAVYDLFLKVECKKPAVKNAEISAVLETPEDEVKSGKEIVIRATIKNTGEETTTYTLGVEGNELFSIAESINPAALTLEPGKSGDVLITLKLDSDAEGDQVFNINALFDGEEVRQPVSLTIAPRVGIDITGAAIGESIRENWFIWAIVIVNIILIIAIIIVAVRMSRA